MIEPLRMASLLRSKNSEDVQGVEAVRIGLENRHVTERGLVELTVLM